MKFLFCPTEAHDRASVGGKACALAALQDAGIRIPPWFSVRAAALAASLDAGDARLLQAVHGADEAMSILAHLHPCAELKQELAQALAELCPANELVAVRSSAADEDSAQHSFAGQFDSFLFVHPNDVLEEIQAVWRSGFSERIFAYRHQHGLTPSPGPPAVLIQRMVNADSAGVAFGADPATGRRGVALVSAVFGLGSALVSGEANADTYLVDRDGTIMEKRPARKDVAHRFDASSDERVSSMPLSKADTERPVLQDEQIKAVADLVRRAGRHFGRPQDIEWAMDSGQLYLLQSRPITSLVAMADPDGNVNLWDNSNITESYGGITAPLTFSFARHAYEGVYRQFCRLMCVPKAVIANNSSLFGGMLGLCRGRVYYNLLNWYRLLTLLPGYSLNRPFFEQMLGIKARLPESALVWLAPSTPPGKIRESFNLVRMLAAIVLNRFRLSAWIRQFHDRVAAALAPPRVPLELMRPEEIVGYYRRLECQLLTRWDAPVINDFFTMIHVGLLHRLAAKWCGDASGSLPNALLTGEGGIVSSEPYRRMSELARIASARPGFVELLLHGATETILRDMVAFPEFKARFADYLARFGERCLDELKLESSTLDDDPLPLLRSVGHAATRTGSVNASSLGRITDSPRDKAEAQVKSALGRRCLRRVLFFWILGEARAGVRNRENLRFERTRVFGRVRRIVVELGRQLHALELLAAPRDIFYLELDEVLGFIEGTATCTDLKGLVALRQAEFDAFGKGPVPADRFETRGIVYQGNSFQSAAPPAHPLSGEQRRGMGCCPGLVRGQVRIVTDPRQALIQPGEILVAQRTDPGWVMLFPLAAGLLVERGSLLSHSAIVAREMGLPAIMAIPELTLWLRDNDWVEMDGSTGLVRRIEAVREEASHA